MDNRDGSRTRSTQDQENTCKPIGTKENGWIPACGGRGPHSWIVASQETPMRYALIPVLSVILAVSVATAGGNLLKDGGFEQLIDKPDENGNPFKVWGGWKWY